MKKINNLFCTAIVGKTPTRKNIQFHIFSSVLTICICTAMFISSTFAWFTSTYHFEGGKIKTSTYYITVYDGENNILNSKVGDNNSLYYYKEVDRLNRKDEHLFTIKANGTAIAGYCKINVGNVEKYIQLHKDKEVKLTLQAKVGTTITFESIWGELLKDKVLSQIETNNNMSIVISNTPHITYTVVEGAKIEDIAAYYSILAEDILIYNGIESITPGMEIFIPYVDENDFKEPYKPQVTQDSETGNNKVMEDSEDKVESENQTELENETSEDTETLQSPTATEEPSPSPSDTLDINSDVTSSPDQEGVSIPQQTTPTDISSYSGEN